MLDYKRELTLHIQGLTIYAHEVFQEIDKATQVEILPNVDIHSIYIHKVGGTKPQLLHVIYLDINEQVEQQAYMCNYIEGNLVCSPVEDIKVNHPFTKEKVLTGDPLGLVIHLSSEYINKIGWVGFYQGSLPWNINPYILHSSSNSLLTYLQF